VKLKKSKIITKSKAKKLDNIFNERPGEVHQGPTIEHTLKSGGFKKNFSEQQTIQISKVKKEPTEHSLLQGELKHFHCETCQKSFKSPVYLKKHQLVHTNIRKFECIHCQKKFKRTDHLQIHMASHSSERNHKCSKCGKTFKTMSDRIKHERKFCKLK
jgi:uncharacterized Zn-finger protein